MKRAPTPGRTCASSASSNWPRAAPSFSTRSAISPCTCRARSCACWRKNRSRRLGSGKAVAPGHPLHLRHQPGPGKGDRRKALPPGPLFPHHELPHLSAAPARPPRRHPASGRPLRRASFRWRSEKANSASRHPAREKLLAYPWPGNVRELQNTIERAVIIGRGPEIGQTEIILPEQAFPVPDSFNLNGNLKAVASRAQKLAEKMKIGQVLAETRFNRTRGGRDPRRSATRPCSTRSRNMAWLKKIRASSWWEKSAWLLIEAIVSPQPGHVERPGGRPGPAAGNVPLIYMFWHRHILFVIHQFRNCGARPLISLSSDGELVAAVAEEFGMDPVRGSSSKGGARAFLHMARCVRQEKGRGADHRRRAARARPRGQGGAVQLAAEDGGLRHSHQLGRSRVKVLEKAGTAS